MNRTTAIGFSGTSDGVRAGFGVEDLGKRYPGGHWGLRHATAEFAPGRMTAVLGPNGAGKSTLIHMLAGAIHPTEGRVVMHDAHSRIGWSSQRTTIDWYLNVLQNVVLGGRLHGMGRRESEARARELLSQFGLESQINADVSMLSGGQQQRIQVARTLMPDPDIMLLDEPTASLDVEASEAVLDLIRSRARNGALVLVSSHDLGLLERYCDDVLFVHESAVLAHAPMDTFLRQFTPTDTLTLTLAHPVTEAVRDRLAPFHPQTHDASDRNVVVSLAEGESLAEIVHALGDTAVVLEAARQPASLRDIYLKMTSRKDQT